jgi:hypothetical protein
MNVEHMVECELAEENEVFGENRPQRNFVRRKSNMT